MSTPTPTSTPPPTCVTVRELIEQLSEMPLDLPILIEQDDMRWPVLNDTPCVRLGVATYDGYRDGHNQWFNFRYATRNHPREEHERVVIVLKASDDE